ncbi:MAG: hypothetical protein Q9221_003000 [Calogaya cf. arnoldii]
MSTDTGVRLDLFVKVHCITRATSGGEGGTDIFAVGRDGDLQHKHYFSRWKDRVSLGGTIYGRPRAIAPQVKRIDVFAKGKGKESKLYQKTSVGGEWKELAASGRTGSTCKVLSHLPPSFQTAVMREGKTLDVFVKQSDSKLYRRLCVTDTDLTATERDTDRTLALTAHPGSRVRDLKFGSYIATERKE